MAAWTLTALFTAAAGNEVTGYNLFDTQDGGNILCDLDPTCRHLTEAEIAESRKIFGETIDYHRVKIFSRPNFLLLPYQKLTGDRINASSFSGNMHWHKDDLHSADYATASPGQKSIFFHEMTHIWQHGRKSLLLAGLKDWISSGFNYAATYDYKTPFKKNFADYYLEQQAEIVEYYIYHREALPPELRSREKARPRFCPELHAYENLMRQELPVQTVDYCPPQPMK